MNLMKRFSGSNLEGNWFRKLIQKKSYRKLSINFEKSVIFNGNLRNFIKLFKHVFNKD